MHVGLPVRDFHLLTPTTCHKRSRLKNAKTSSCVFCANEIASHKPKLFGLWPIL